jgi:hypothetical protein
MGRLQSQCLPVHILSTKVTANHTYTGDDMRRVITRFDKDNIRANQPLLDLITDFANSKGVTPAQISLAWMLHKNDFIVPIPGSRKLETHPGNLGAADVDLTDESSHRSKQSWRRSRSTEPHRRGHRQAPRNHLTHPHRTGPSLVYSHHSARLAGPSANRRPRTAAPFQFAAPRLGGPVKCAKRPPLTVTDQHSRPPAGTVRLRAAAGAL